MNLTHLLADLATMSLDVTRWLLPKIPHWDKMGKLTKMVVFTIEMEHINTNLFSYWNTMLMWQFSP